MMIHVDSGHPRTGTTAVMKALIAGGMEAAYNTDRDALIHATSDEEYKLNPEHLYELEEEQLRTLRYWPERYDGKLVKRMYHGAILLGAHAYRVAFMMRDWEEIRQSAIASDVRLTIHSEDEYETKMAHAIGIMRERRDMDVTVLRYREDLIADPLGSFQHLRDRGWPIDAEKAAAEIKPELCRYRVENLTVGIA